MPKISEEEKVFGLPENWEWVRLGDIGITNIGLTYSPKNISDHGTLVLRSSNIQNGEIELIDNVRVDLEVKENVLVKQGDLLICARNGSRSLVGKCALLRNIPEPMAFGAFMAIYRSSLNEYIKIFLESPIYRKSLEDVTTTTINQITQENLKNTLVPLPPFAEQKRITSKVDELMALCDKLEDKRTDNLKTHRTLVKSLLVTLIQAKGTDELQTAWKQMSVHFDTLFCTEDSIDQLKQTLLHLAIMGKLVKQDPNEEPSSELIKKIEIEKERLINEGRLKKEKLLPAITEKEMLYDLPTGWEWVRLNNVIDVRDGTHDSPKDAIGDDTFPLVTSKDFSNGKINFDSARRISKQDHLEISRRSKVDKLDILFSMIGGNLGNQVIVTEEREFSIKNLALFKYYNKELTLPFFIKKITEYLAYTLQSNAIGGAQPFVALGFLRKIVIALPPVEEQKRIVAKVDELMSLCDNIKTKILKAEEIKGSLSKTIFEKAIA